MIRSSFADELVKIAEEGNSWVWPTAAIGGGALLGLGALALSKPGIRASFTTGLKGLTTRGGARGIEQKLVSKGPPQEIVDQASRIVKAVEERGLDPSSLRIGIVGAGGTGKSTLGREVSNQLGMRFTEMDTVVPKSISRGRNWYAVRNKDIPVGSVVEQSHLLTHNLNHGGISPEAFDLIVHMEKPATEVKKQILRRGRGAYQLDVYDYDKFQGAVRKGFDATDGAVQNAGGGTRFKFRPSTGFRQTENLQREVAQAGKDPKNVGRQQLVMMASDGQKSLLPGNYAYLKNDSLLQGGGALVAGGAAGAGAHSLLTKKEQETA